MKKSGSALFNMKEGRIILILSLIIFLLLGYILGPTYLKETKVIELTKDECVELASISEEGRRDCIETGLKMYGYTDGRDCLNDRIGYQDFCRGHRFWVEAELFKSCKESFPALHDILPNCLAGIEGFNIQGPNEFHVDYG